MIKNNGSAQAGLNGRRPRKKEMRPRKRYVLKISKAKFRKAITGTGGLKSLIQERLSCSCSTVHTLLNKEGWEDVYEFWLQEREQVKDVAEQTVIDAMKNKADLGLAFRAAKWYLEQLGKDRGFGKQQAPPREGSGEDGAPRLAIGTLNLSIEVREKILEALEAAEGPRLIEAKVIE